MTLSSIARGFHSEEIQGTDLPPKYPVTLEEHDRREYLGHMKSHISSTSVVVVLLSPFAYGILKSLIPSLRNFCIGLTFANSQVYQISVVCLFVRPLQGRTSLFLYFVIGLSYIIRNITFLPSWFPSIPPPGNYPSLLDFCTPFKPSLGLSLVAAVGSITGCISGGGY